MLVYLQRLLQERTSLTEVRQRMADTAATEERDLSESEQAEIANMAQRCITIDNQLQNYNQQTEADRAFAALAERFSSHDDSLAPARGQRTTAPAPQTPGQTFTESDDYRNYPGRGQGQSVELSEYLQLRAPISTGDLAIPNVVIAPREQVTPVSPLLQIIDVQRISSGVAEWVEVGPDPLAVVTPEGLAKTEAAITFAPKTASLQTYAHWVQITRQALSDAAYIRSLVETKLRRGLMRAIEDAVADALTAATLPTASVPMGGALIEAIRVGVGTVQEAGYSPNAVVLNPADWATLDMSVYGSTLGGPTVGNSFWGLRPVAASSQPAGTATVGDFQSGVSWLDRGVTDVFLTDSHSDFFIKNILVILAEARGKAVVPEPNALVECAVALT